MSSAESTRTLPRSAAGSTYVTVHERRRSPRLAGCPPVALLGRSGYVQDISRGGICLVSRQPIKVGDRQPLQLRDDLDGSQQTLEAEVVWVAGGRAGFRWVRLTAAQDAWLSRRFVVWLQALEGASRR